jgi:hypothetical protein
MKIKQIFTLITVAILSLNLSGQDLKLKEVDLPISKKAKKSGMYVETVVKDDNAYSTFISYDLKKQLGFDVITFDKKGNVLINTEEIATAETGAKYGIKIPSPGKIDVPGAGQSVLAVVGSVGVLGKFKVKKGTFEPKYATSVDYGGNITTYTPVLRGFKFVEKEAIKTDFTAGMFVINPKDGEIERNYNLIEGMVNNVVGYIPATGSTAFLGAIVEKVSIKEPTEFAGNRLLHGVFDGKTMRFTKENITVFPHAVTIPISRVTTPEGNKAVLVSALKVVTTYAPQRKWIASNPKLMSVLSIDKEGNLADSITWESKSVRGNFALTANDDATYVLGMINSSYDGFYRFDIGKVTDLQVTKIQAGKLVFNKTFSIEEMASKLAGSKGKGKLKLNSTIWCSGFKDLPNGDILALFASPSDYFMVQFSTAGELKASYTAKRVDGKDLFHKDNLVHVSGDHVYIIFREQSAAIAQGVSKSFSRNSNTYMKDLSFSRIDELMTYANVVRINPKDMTITNPVEINDYVLLGDYPIFDGDDGAVLLTGRKLKGDYKVFAVK